MPNKNKCNTIIHKNEHSCIKHELNREHCRTREEHIEFDIPKARVKTDICQTCQN